MVSIAAALAVCAAFLGIATASAIAAPEATLTYAPQGSFSNELGTGNASSPQSPLAVDSHGNIFFADEFDVDSAVVRIYAPNPTLGGTLLTVVEGSFPSDIAVDPTTDDLYVQEAGTFGFGAVKRFISDGKATPSYTKVPGFEPPAGGQIAVDPSTHDLLVADPGAESIRRYNTSGGPAGTVSIPGVNPSKVAVAADGSLYVPSGSSVLHLSGVGAVLGEIENVGDVRALTVNPKDQSLVVSTGNLLKVYSPAGGLLFITDAARSFTGLAIDGPSERLYATNTDFFSPGSIFFFDPVISPGLEPVTVSAVSSTSFHVETEVDPGEESPGGAVPAGSGVRFEYRSVGSADWIQRPNKPVTAPATIGEDIDDLEPNLSYEVRAVAFNDFFVHPSDPVVAVTVATTPVVNTSSATDISETSAVLNGTINSVGKQTTYYFEYGLTDAYGSKVPLGIEGVAGGAHGVRSYSRTIRGLASGTTYHFRLVATNEIGTARGSDRSFATAGTASTVARSFEQVTPADKKGATIYPTFGFQVKADGNGFSYQNHTGSLSTPIHAQTLSVRGANDWRSGISLDPPNNPSTATFFFQSTLAISDDFAHTLVVSNRALRPGALEGGANLFVSNLNTGELQLIAESDEPEAFATFTGIQTTGKFVAGAPDFSWVMFESPVALVSGAPPNALYRWSQDGGLDVVSRLPDGEMVSIYGKGPNQGRVRLVSEDGSRIYFATGTGPAPGLYLREGGASKAVSVSEVSGEPTGPQPAYLVGVTEDGRYAFFGIHDSSVKLTADAEGTGSGGTGDLYRYDAETGKLRYLGAQVFSGYNPPEFGEFGTAPDGDTVYFNRSRPGIDSEGNPVTLIELSVWQDGTVHTILSRLAAATQTFASPNGRYLAIQSPGSPVRLYDADTDELSCASCLSDHTPVSGTMALEELQLSNRLVQSVTDDGTVFFSTRGRLVAADVNGTSDVYSFRNGEPRLVSPGNAPFDATFAGISEDASDVFFTTSQSLVGRDGDEASDVYDARVGGGLPAQSPAPLQDCLRDDCKATPQAGPELPFGGSEAIQSKGNPPQSRRKSCGKGKKPRKVRGKTHCVKQDGTHKKPAKRSRASQERNR